MTDDDIERKLMLKDALTLGLMKRSELTPEEERLVYPVIAEELAPDYEPRPFSYDTGDFEPVKEELPLAQRIPMRVGPEQESSWPFYLEIGFKLFAVFCFIIGFSILITGGLK